MSTGYLLLEMQAFGDRTPNLSARPLPAKVKAAVVKEHLEHAGLGSRRFTFLSFRVGRAVAQTIAGKNIAEIVAPVNWKPETIARRYVGGTKTTRDPTGTVPGAVKARYVASNALPSSVNPAVWALFHLRSAPPRGVFQPATACTVSPPTSPQITTHRA